MSLEMSLQQPEKEAFSLLPVIIIDSTNTISVAVRSKDEQEGRISSAGRMYS